MNHMDHLEARVDAVVAANRRRNGETALGGYFLMHTSLLLSETIAGGIYKAKQDASPTFPVFARLCGYSQLSTTME